MNIIQKIRNLIFGKSEVIEAPVPVEVKPTVKEMVEQACESEANQLRHMGSFLKSTNLLKPLRFKDWAAFAKGYNGPAYATHGYDVKLANAYARLSQPKK